MTQGQITTWGSGLTPGAALDVAVVMPTLMRSSIRRAIRSVYRQSFDGRIQIMVGIDTREGPVDPASLGQGLPANMALTVLEPGYSTTRRRGGLHEALGGSLRTALSWLAHAPLVAYLDDDCWWDPEHVARMVEAIRLRDWAFSKRWYVAPGTSFPLGIDNFESLGPDRGAYRQQEGGFCDTNTLMIDKTRCEDVLAAWGRCVNGDVSGRGCDRLVFAALRRHERFGATGRPTVYYQMSESDGMHGARMDHLRKALKPFRGYERIVEGNHAQAGFEFFSRHYVTGDPADGLAWAYGCLMRAGDTAGARAVAAHVGAAIDKPAWRAVAGESLDVPAGAVGESATRILFLLALRAVSDGDLQRATGLLRRSLAVAEPGGTLRDIVSAELRRLEAHAAVGHP